MQFHNSCCCTSFHISKTYNYKELQGVQLKNKLYISYTSQWSTNWQHTFSAPIDVQVLLLSCWGLDIILSSSVDVIHTQKVRMKPILLTGTLSHIHMLLLNLYPFYFVSAALMSPLL